MRRILDIETMRAASRAAKGNNFVVGFVPTMGGLHGGHLALVRRACEVADFVVVSIFVNPTQFGPSEDFVNYPRTIDKDLELCESCGVQVVFSPSAEMMYPREHQTYVCVEELSKSLCGKVRPGHFKGVASVVMKLLHIVEPDVVFFGQKDFQQLMILKRMTADMNMPLRVDSIPTVRDVDGVALSSRNAYLSDSERIRARAIPAALDAAQRMVESGEKRPEVIVEAVVQLLLVHGVDVDYVEMCDAETLKPVVAVASNVLLAIAGYVGKTRLIDNRLLTLPGK